MTADRRSTTLHEKNDLQHSRPFVSTAKKLYKLLGSNIQLWYDNMFLALYIYFNIYILSIYLVDFVIFSTSPGSIPSLRRGIPCIFLLRTSVTVATARYDSVGDRFLISWSTTRNQTPTKFIQLLTPAAAIKTPPRVSHVHNTNMNTRKTHGCCNYGSRTTPLVRALQS